MHQWVLCAAQRRRVPPARCPAASLERVTGLSPWGNWRDELALVRGDIVEHAASVRYEVRNASLHGPVVYRGAAKEHAGYGNDDWMRPRSERRVDLAFAHLVSTSGGSAYFGNYLMADFPAALWVEDALARLWLPTKPYQHGEGYRRLLDLDDAPAPAYARIERLFVYTDYGQNASKEDRFRTLRSRLRSHLARPTADAAPGVYIRRGSAGEQRVLLNEQAVVEWLEARGIRIIDPSVASAEEVAAQSLDARIVIAVEGSHLAHAIYSASEAATFIVVQPPDRFSMTFKAFTDRMGMRFSFLVGDAGPGGFSLRIDELESLLDCAAR